MKSIFAISIVFLISIGTYFTFNLWESTEGDYTYHLQGYTLISVEDDLEEGVTLRPKGSILSTNQVNEITYTYTYKIKKGFNVSTFIEDRALKLNEDTKLDDYGLIKVDVTQQNIIQETEDFYILEVVAVVYLREALTLEEVSLYNQLRSFSITLKPTFNS